jgi:glycosyltransferase involved in cell wall biosynthesis
MIAPPYFDIPPAGYGGIESMVADLVDGLVDAGHRVFLIGAGRPGTRADYVPVWDAPVPDRLGDTFPEVLHAVKSRQAVETLLASEPIDVVHDHTYAGPINAAWYATEGIPMVVTMHGPADHPDLLAYYRQLGTTVQLVAISERQRTLAPDLSWIGTVHNALSVDDWPFVADKREYAVFLGRFSPDKGAHLAVEAAHEAGLPLILAGKCTEPLEKQYFNQEVAPRMWPDDSMVGVADAAAKRALLAGAQCLLFPVQWEEPFGMVLIEAMACGTPVVALRSGSVPEIVMDGVTGIVCDLPEDLSVAVKAARHLDPAACRAHVARNFNLRGLVDGYVTAYRAVIGQDAGRYSIALTR